MSEREFESRLTGAVVKEYTVDEDSMFEVIYRDQVIMVEQFKIKAILTSIDRQECDRLYEAQYPRLVYLKKQA